jgi:hypothetical protein
MPPRRADLTVELAKAERADEELDRGFAVLVEKVRSDLLRHGR